MLTRRKLLAAPVLAGLSGCTSTPKLVAGSRETPENRLIAEIIAQLLERKLKARLDRRVGITGAMSVYNSLQGGEMDVYPEYSRIAFKVLLKAQDQQDADLMLGVMRKGLEVNAQASCLPFLGLENTHTAVVMADNPNFFSMQKLSEAAASKDGWRLGCTSEFAQSTEGYNELKVQYKLTERGGTRLEPVNQLFFGLRERRIDILITGSTDPRLRDPKYKVLEDDLRTFSPNPGVIIYRLEAARKYPSILPVLESLSGKLDQLTMVNLNAEVELNKRGFEDVAVEWLTARKLV